MAGHGCIIFPANSVVQQTARGPGNRCQESEMMDREGVSISRLCECALTHGNDPGQRVGTKTTWIRATPSCSDITACHSNNHLRNVGTSFPLSVLAIFLFISNHKITVENTHKCPMFHMSAFGPLTSLILYAYKVPCLLPLLPFSR